MMYDRRRYRRAETALDVTIEAPAGHWRGKALGLSLYGMKVTSAAELMPLTPGAKVRVWLHPGDRIPSLCLPASVVGTDRDGIGLYFLNLRTEHSARLKTLVDGLLLQEWQTSVNDNQAVTGTGGEKKNVWARVREFFDPIIIPGRPPKAAAVSDPTNIRRS